MLIQTWTQIRDPSPHSGMNVYCESRCVPVGGAVELKVALKPEIAGQFDVKLYIDLKEGKCISFRIAGNVEHPSVTVNKVQNVLVYVIFWCKPVVNFV